MKCAAASLMLLFAIVLGGCGDDEPPAPTSVDELKDYVVHALEENDPDAMDRITDWSDTPLDLRGKLGQVDALLHEQIDQSDMAVYDVTVHEDAGYLPDPYLSAERPLAPSGAFDFWLIVSLRGTPSNGEGEMTLRLYLPVRRDGQRFTIVGPKYAEKSAERATGVSSPKSLDIAAGTVVADTGTIRIVSRGRSDSSSSSCVTRDGVMRCRNATPSFALMRFYTGSAEYLDDSRLRQNETFDIDIQLADQSDEQIYAELKHLFETHLGLIIEERDIELECLVIDVSQELPPFIEKSTRVRQSGGTSLKGYEFRGTTLPAMEIRLSDWIKHHIIIKGASEYGETRFDADWPVKRGDAVGCAIELRNAGVDVEIETRPIKHLVIDRHTASIKDFMKQVERDGDK